VLDAAQARRPCESSAGAKSALMGRGASSTKRAPARFKRQRPTWPMTRIKASGPKAKGRYCNPVPHGPAFVRLRRRATACRRASSPRRTTGTVMGSRFRWSAGTDQAVQRTAGRRDRPALSQSQKLGQHRRSGSRDPFGEKERSAVARFAVSREVHSQQPSKRRIVYREDARRLEKQCLTQCGRPLLTDCARHSRNPSRTGRPLPG